MSYQCPYPPQTGLTKSTHIRTLTNLGYHIYTPLCCTIKILQKLFKEEGGLKTLLVLMTLLLLLLSR